MTNEEIIAVMKTRVVTVDELQQWLGKNNRSARHWLSELGKVFPVISTSNLKGHKIATSAEDLALVADSIKNRRNKAISIFEGSKQLRIFQKQFGVTDDGQLSLEF